MPKPATDIEYHITLHTPVGIKLGAEIVPVRSFDATIDSQQGITSIVFKIDRIWRAGAATLEILRGVAFRSSLTIPIRNIAGLVPQPFVER